MNAKNTLIRHLEGYKHLYNISHKDSITSIDFMSGLRGMYPTRWSITIMVNFSDGKKVCIWRGEGGSKDPQIESVEDLESILIEKAINEIMSAGISVMIRISNELQNERKH